MYGIPNYKSRWKKLFGPPFDGRNVSPASRTSSSTPTKSKAFAAIPFLRPTWRRISNCCTSSMGIHCPIRFTDLMNDLMLTQMKLMKLRKTLSRDLTTNLLPMSELKNYLMTSTCCQKLWFRNKHNLCLKTLRLW